MPTVDLSHLTPEFAAQVTDVQTFCAEVGVDLRPTCARRDPFEQARLWRAPKPRAAIEQEIARLNRLSCPFLAHCLESVGPQDGPAVTKAIPGLSWHQWDEAVDFGWYVDGKYIDSSTQTITVKGKPINGYRVLGARATTLGLTHGGTAWGWDWAHVQQRREASPHRIHRMQEIDAVMHERFGKS